MSRLVSPLKMLRELNQDEGKSQINQKLIWILFKIIKEENKSMELKIKTKKEKMIIKIIIQTESLKKIKFF